MATKTEICNMALAHVNAGGVLDVESENGANARICRVFYETARDAVLRDFNWPFSTEIATLGLVEEDPNDEWAYSYRMPSDCLLLRRVLSGVRNDSRQSRSPYKIGRDADGLLLFSDLDEVQVEYTIRADDESRYQPDFILALSYRLAAYIAPSLTGGDPFKLGARALEMYAFELSVARANAANEEQPDEEVESEFIRGR